MLLDREFPPDIRVENEAFSLIKEGHEIHLLSYNYYNKKSTEVYRGINIHRFNIHKEVAKKSLGFIHIFPLYRRIWRKEVFSLLKCLSIDVVHIHDLPLCILSKDLRKHGIKIVAEMHENYPHLVAEQPYMNSVFGKLYFRKYKWFDKEREWLEDVDEVICVAPEMSNRLKKVLSSSKPISVVPNTYSFNSFETEQVEIKGLCRRFKDKFVVTYIGGFDPIRGINILIESISKVKNQIPGLLLLLVGDGSISNDLRKQAQLLNIMDIVVFEGWQPSKYVKAYIESSSVCVIPHIRSVQTDNSSPNKLFQYLFAQKPVISSNCTSIEKIITQEKCGLVFLERDVDDLAEKLLFLYNHPDELIKMGLNGHSAVMAKYNWEITVIPLLELYRNF